MDDITLFNEVQYELKITFNNDAIKYENYLNNKIEELDSLNKKFSNKTTFQPFPVKYINKKKDFLKEIINEKQQAL